MLYVYCVLLIVEIILLETSGLNLNCTNDYDTLMSCHIDARNCTKVRLTLKETERFETRTCAFEPCVRGCCCGIEMTSLLIVSYTFDADVYEDGEKVHSQTIGIYETIKPQTPSIISVSKLNEIYHIKWRTNTKRSIREELWAIVTYKTKGDLPKYSERIKPRLSDDVNHFELLGYDLEPSTTYVVSVKTYTGFNVSSDGSEEVEFTTDSSRKAFLIAVVLSLCVVAVVVSGASYFSLIKLKGKLWDKAVNVGKPKLLDIKPKKEVILTPELLSVYSLSIEPLVPKNSLMSSKESLWDGGGGSGQSSGVGSASSSLGYATTRPGDSEACVIEALKINFPMFTPSTNTPGSEEHKANCGGVRAETTSAPLAYDNTVYMAQSPESTRELEAQLVSDSGYHSSDARPPQDFMFPHESANAGDYHSCVPNVNGFQDFENPSNNVSEHNSEGQSLITGFTDVLQSPETGFFQFGFPQVSADISVDSDYHRV